MGRLSIEQRVRRNVTRRRKKPPRHYPLFAGMLDELGWTRTPQEEYAHLVEQAERWSEADERMSERDREAAVREKLLGHRRSPAAIEALGLARFLEDGASLPLIDAVWPPV